MGKQRQTGEYQMDGEAMRSIRLAATSQQRKERG